MAVPASFADADDVSLVIAIARYNPDAFAEAYRRHGGAVYALAARLLWDRAIAEETVQEVFLRLWEQPERYDQSRGALRLDPTRTYQLWGLTEQHTISLGVMGTHPKVVAFKAAGGPLGLAITTEVAGGVAVSAQQPDAVGNVS